MIEFQAALGMLLPKEWLEYFEVVEIKEANNEWQIVLHEKENLIPRELIGKDAVKDGFTNPVEINDYPLRGKPTYLKFYRRRWKVAGEDESHFNSYEFHPKGMKATKEFGAFLKELDREEADQHGSDW